MRLLLGSLTRQSLQQTTVLLWILWTIRPHNQMLLQGCCFRSLEALLGIIIYTSLSLSLEACFCRSHYDNAERLFTILKQSLVLGILTYVPFHLCEAFHFSMRLTVLREMLSEFRSLPSFSILCEFVDFRFPLVRNLGSGGGKEEEKALSSLRNLVTGD